VHVRDQGHLLRWRGPRNHVVNPSSTGPVAGARGAPRTGGYVHSVALPFPVRFAIVNAGAELVGLGGVGALSAWAALSIGPDAPATGPVEDGFTT